MTKEIRISIPDKTIKLYLQSYKFLTHKEASQMRVKYRQIERTIFKLQHHLSRVGKVLLKQTQQTPGTWQTCFYMLYLKYER